MDGNNRWARRRGLPKIMGHRAGVKAIERVLEAADDAGVKVITLYAFSTENWKRPKREVAALMRLMEEYIRAERERLIEKGIRFTALGRIDEFPAHLAGELRALERDTKGGTGLHLCMALNYGGRREIVDAVKAICDEAVKGAISPGGIDERVFSRYLYTKEIRDPDLLIRTSGEMRLSNFLLWQMSYGEIYVTTKLWPDFGKADFRKAVEEYSRRSRRFGG